MSKETSHPGASQPDKFRELARELECDEDEVAFDEALRRIARGPKPEPTFEGKK